MEARGGPGAPGGGGGGGCGGAGAGPAAGGGSVLERAREHWDEFRRATPEEHKK